MLSLVEALRGKKVDACAITSAEAITGPYDVLAACEGPSLEVIGKFILKECASIPGFKQSMTCLVLTTRKTVAPLTSHVE